MRSSTSILVALVVALVGSTAGGCAATMYETDGYSTTSSMIAVAPGVWAVQGYSVPVYYSGGAYFVWSNDVWYRSAYASYGFAPVPITVVPWGVRTVVPYGGYYAPPPYYGGGYYGGGYYGGGYYGGGYYGGRPAPPVYVNPPPGGYRPAPPMHVTPPSSGGYNPAPPMNVRPPSYNPAPPMNVRPPSYNPAPPMHVQPPAYNPPPPRVMPPSGGGGGGPNPPPPRVLPR